MTEKIWVTKYALSKGIFETEGEAVGEGLFKAHKQYDYFHGEGRDWHRTKESAIVRAENMRIAKIASLKKQIAKLEKLSFQP